MSSKTLSELCVNDAALCRRVFVVRGREFRDDVDDTAEDFEFDLLAALEAGPPAYGLRNHKRHFISYGDGHGMPYTGVRLRSQCRVPVRVCQELGAAANERASMSCAKP